MAPKVRRVVVIGAAIVVMASYIFTGLSDCLRSLVRAAKKDCHLSPISGI